MELTPDRVPLRAVVTLGLVSVLPVFLSLGSFRPLGADGGFPKVPVVDAFLHTGLEWAALSAAFFACVLTFFHFRHTRHAVLPVLGLSMLTACVVDGFHLLAVEGQIETAASPEQFIAVSWTLSRLAHSLILMAGLIVVLLRPRFLRMRNREVLFGALGIAVTLGSYAVLTSLSDHSEFLNWVRPGALIKRPYDLLPVVPLVVSGSLLAAVFSRRLHSPFGTALFLSLVPAISAQLYMAFGSDLVGDPAANSAHLLKAVSYLIPFLGLLFEYQATYAMLRDRSRSLVQLNERLNHQATHDALTGLPNRVSFEYQVSRAISLADRSQNFAAILLLDLDGFKDVNDSAGHEAGDLILTTTAERLAANVRASDVVSRLGGDEFTILLGDLPRQEFAAVVARQLIDSISKPTIHQGKELMVTPSIGIATFPTDGDDVEDLMRAADHAMYEIKRSGGRGFRYFDSSTDQVARDLVALRTDLRRGVEEDEFVLHYQPQIDIHRQTLIGAEALVRWNHPEHGLLPPGRFLEAAEQTGLIVELGYWVLKAAAQQQSRWAAELGPLRMGINVSFRQIRESDFARRARQIIAASGADPGRIDLELTETWIMEDHESAIQHLAPLKELGMRVAVDDFGTGYSTLWALDKLPLDTLKVDRSFVTDIHENSSRQAMVRGILTIAEGLGLEVIAEGIERDVELLWLTENGVRFGQGYYFAAPMPADEFEAWAADWEIEKV